MSFDIAEKDSKHHNKSKLIQDYPTTDNSMEETYFRVFAARNKARSMLHGNRKCPPNPQNSNDSQYNSPAVYNRIE